jgi:hypothetical protein
MNGKLVTIFVLTLVIIPMLNVSGNLINAPPNIPIIDGETDGIIGTRYDYTIITFDPENNDVYYKIRWGDCMVVYNAGPYKSGEEVVFPHAFCKLCCGPGPFTIQVKAFDKYGGESDWGTLSVEMDQDEHDSLLHGHAIHDFFDLLFRIFPILKFIIID